MKNEIKIDLPSRREKRYVVRSSKQFLKLLSPYVKRKKFSNNEHVYTIYFNNDEHVVPFEYSIKARRYLPGFIELPVLDNDVYFLDLKMGKGEHYKEKIRLEATLEEATKIINEKYSFSEIPLRPYVLVEYLRHHYIPKNTGGVRITLDTNLKYFFFSKGQREGIEIGREDDYTRIEIKEQGQSNKDLIILMEELLGRINAFPIISKKFTAYNFLGLYYVKTFGTPFFKELKGCEIEAKLETDSEKAFQEAKKIFKEGKSGFKLSSRFPYTFESASINRYYRDNEGLFKAMFRGDKAEVVRKGNVEIIKNPLNLNCILKRKEEKGNVVPIDSEMIRSAQLQGELYRMRKAFWVDNQRTGRFYHISLDHCLGLSGILNQMEIEYTGTYINTSHASNTNEKEIIGDISNIAKILIEKIPLLKPSLLTKQKWLGIK